MTNKNWIENLHLIFVLVSLSAVTLSLVFSLIYLLAQWRLKHKKNLAQDHLPSLEVLDQYVIRSLVFGFGSISVLLFSGIMLAHLVWKRDWIHDEKFLIAICTWIWIALILGIRFKLGIRGDKFFYSIFVGFILLVASCILAWVM